MPPSAPPLNETLSTVCTCIYIHNVRVYWYTPCYWEVSHPIVCTGIGDALPTLGQTQFSLPLLENPAFLPETTPTADACDQDAALATPISRCPSLSRLKENYYSGLESPAGVRWLKAVESRRTPFKPQVHTYYIYIYTLYMYCTCTLCIIYTCNSRQLSGTLVLKTFVWWICSFVNICLVYL